VETKSCSLGMQLYEMPLCEMPLYEMPLTETVKEENKCKEKD
jgi:hypothetical protein